MTKSKSKKKAKITEQPNPLQTLPPGLRLPPRLFATDRFSIKCLNIYSLPEIFGSYDRKGSSTSELKISTGSGKESLKKEMIGFLDLDELNHH
ncbi:unnamed protein product [Brassica oleracea var. botrytis]|uniref:(rape) hypothetical protein n=1 Tax=Brassica napus TaxID=3708 RepID=A0A816I877_BRANA|nr:unnamed protein product [Brassica napus]